MRTGPPTGDSGTTPPSDGYAGRDPRKEKERSERHEKRRQRQEAQARKEEQDRERDRERARDKDRHHRDRERERERSRDRRASEDPTWASGHSSASYHTPPQPRYREPDPLSSSLPRSATYHEGGRPGSYTGRDGMPIPGPKPYMRREETWNGSTTSTPHSRDPRDPYGASYSSHHSARKPSHDAGIPRGSPHMSDTSSVHTATMAEEQGPVREGYVETKTAEELKIEEVRRKTREARGVSQAPSVGSPHLSSSNRSNHSHSHSGGSFESHATEYYMREREEAARREQAQRETDLRIKREVDEMERVAKLQRAAERKREKAQKDTLRAQAEMAARFSRSSEIGTGSHARERSAEPAVGRRRGSSSVSRDDSFRPTGPSRPASEQGTAAEPMGSIAETILGSLRGFGSRGPLGPAKLSPPHPELRRRNSISSPSLEKQEARRTKDEFKRFGPPPGPPPPQMAPLNGGARKASMPDSGYSSPDPSEKKTSPIAVEKRTPSQATAPDTPTPKSKKLATDSPSVSVIPPTPTEAEPVKSSWLSILSGMGSAKSSTAGSMVSEASTSTVKAAEG